MARFKKGTLDHDGNGKKGGSRKKSPALPRADDPAGQCLIDLGRHARRSGIKRTDCPLIGEDAGLWQAGWDYQDAV